MGNRGSKKEEKDEIEIEDEGMSLGGLLGRLITLFNSKPHSGHRASRYKYAHTNCLVHFSLYLANL